MTNDKTMFLPDAAEVIAAVDGAAAASGLLGEATSYHLASGGKAWRARLAVAGGRSLGLHEAEIVGLAAACERVHQASLVHDDVQDGAACRRGRPTVAKRFSAAASICVGDHLLARAFATLSTLPQGAALAGLFADGISEMATAQAAEFSPALWQGMRWTRYEALIDGKAGAMVVLPLAGAALIAGLPRSDIEQVGAAARILGKAYQAGDDIEDVAADIANGSLNGVIAHFLERADDASRAACLTMLEAARREPLPPSEAAQWAARMQRDEEAVWAWIAVLRPQAAGTVSGRVSLRGHALAPVIDRAAEMLISGAAKPSERKHAA
jgi:geranylgeranyl pyrophosphate synthase